MRQILTQSSQVGRIIAGRRKASKISQSRLAAKLSISQNRLSELEDTPGKLTLDRLLAIANLLGLELVIKEKTTADDPPATEW